MGQRSVVRDEKGSGGGRWWRLLISEDVLNATEPRT